jgi:serine/threonine protein kinase
MNEQWKQWEGQTVDGKFLLGQFLASTDHSAVFLTQLAEPQVRNAAVKFIPADTPGADACLSLWKRAAALTHTNLLAVYDSGRCSMNGRNWLYVVMERAEENLAEILPQRALSADEARDVLSPALDVLVYLHSKGLAHGHLKPSNVLATQDCLKLSSDTLQTLGAPCRLFRSRDIYDAPELPSSPPSAKSDAWSLAATLFATLTQRAPELSQDPAADPAIPADLPALFADIVRHSLRRRPEERWSITNIAARLNPARFAAAAAASAAPVAAAPPLRVPLSPEPAVPLARLPAAAEPPVRQTRPGPKRRPSTVSDYIIPVLLGAAVFLGLIFALPRLFSFRSPAASPQAAAAPEPAVPAKPAEAPKSQAPAPTPEKSPAMNAADDSSPKRVEAKTEDSPVISAAAPIAPPAPVRTKAASEVEGRGEVLDQVLPRVPPKALATITGTVRVVVKVQVDSAGNVTDTALDTPGPSPYFAGLAEKAARQWKFTGAEAAGHGVPSEWLIRFEFVASGVQAVPKQVSP